MIDETWDFVGRMENGVLVMRTSDGKAMLLENGLLYKKPIKDPDAEYECWYEDELPWPGPDDSVTFPLVIQIVAEQATRQFNQLREIAQRIAVLMGDTPERAQGMLQQLAKLNSDHKSDYMLVPNEWLAPGVRTDGKPVNRSRERALAARKNRNVGPRQDRRFDRGGRPTY